jgi:hypothetical protein
MKLLKMMFSYICFRFIFSRTKKSLCKLYNFISINKNILKSVFDFYKYEINDKIALFDGNIYKLYIILSLEYILLLKFIVIKFIFCILF